MEKPLKDSLSGMARDTRKREEETSGLQPHGDGSGTKPQETTPAEPTEVLARWPFPNRDER
jgi:hypothetical protein